MIQSREPRHPRINYNHYNSFASQTYKNNQEQSQHVNVGVQLAQNTIISKRVSSKLKKADVRGNITFKNAQWQVFNMTQISGKIRSWQIPKGLYIENAREANLTHQLSEIRFNSLVNLNLSNNGIQSIQPICSIYLPSLQRLALSYNKITSVKSLRRAYFPNLISCCLGSNRILEYDCLSQLNAPQLKKIYQQHRADPGWCCTFSWIGKLQTNQLLGLYIASDNRIWQKEAQLSFQRKYLKKKQITFYVGYVEGVA